MNTIEITRDQAELLASRLLDVTDPLLVELDVEIRSKFGMVSREDELRRIGEFEKFANDVLR